MHIEAVHFLAVQTNASPAAIWAIVAVAVVCLAFWLTAVSIASRDRGTRRRGAMTMTKPVIGGAHLAAGSRGVAPDRHEAITDQYGVPGQRPEPAQPAQLAESAQAGPDPRDVMPAQRAGDADQAERSTATGDSGR